MLASEQVHFLLQLEAMMDVCALQNNKARKKDADAEPSSWGSLLSGSDIKGDADQTKLIHVFNPHCRSYVFIVTIFETQNGVCKHVPFLSDTQ